MHYFAVLPFLTSHNFPYLTLTFLILTYRSTFPFHCLLSTYFSLSLSILNLPFLPLPNLTFLLITFLTLHYLAFVLQVTFTGSITIFYVFLNTVAFHRKATISSLVTMSIVESNRLRQSASYLLTRSSTRKISSCYVVTMNVPVSTVFTASTTNVSSWIILFKLKLINIIFFLLHVRRSRKETVPQGSSEMLPWVLSI